MRGSWSHAAHPPPLQSRASRALPAVDTHPRARRAHRERHYDQNERLASLFRDRCGDARLHWYEDVVDRPDAWAKIMHQLGLWPTPDASRLRGTTLKNTTHVVHGALPIRSLVSNYDKVARVLRPTKSLSGCWCSFLRIELAVCETLASRQARPGPEQIQAVRSVNPHQFRTAPIYTIVAATIATSSTHRCTAQELSDSQELPAVTLRQAWQGMAALEEASSEEDAVAAALGSNDEACSIAAWYRRAQKRSPSRPSSCRCLQTSSPGSGTTAPASCRARNMVLASRRGPRTGTTTAS